MKQIRSEVEGQSKVLHVIRMQLVSDEEAANQQCISFQVKIPFGCNQCWYDSCSKAPASFSEHVP